jgi:hypothetical protein
MIARMGSSIPFRRPDGGDLYVPSGHTYTVPAGETVKFETVTVDGTLLENGTLLEVTDETQIEDKYGKRVDADEGYVSLGQMLAVRLYTGDDTELPGTDYVSGGQQPTEQPFLVMTEDSPVQVDDRLTWVDGTEYVVETAHDRDAYKQYMLGLVTGDA